MQLIAAGRKAWYGNQCSAVPVKAIPPARSKRIPGVRECEGFGMISSPSQHQPVGSLTHSTCFVVLLGQLT